MQNLIDTVSTTTGLEPTAARRAVGIMLSLVRSQGDQSIVETLFDKIPGASELAEQYGGDTAGSGRLLGMLGGPLAAVAKLQSAGLNMDQIKGLGHEVLDYAKIHAGDELVTDVTSSIPGLNKHL